MSSIKIVNVVGSGNLDVEIDLERLSGDINESIASYDPDKYPAMYVRFTEDAPLITVYRTGKYIITGGDSEEELHIFREQLLSLFSDLGVLEEAKDEWFEVQNYVCTSELGNVQNLNALTIGLGLEKTEYEPEQFPGLIYRPNSGDAVILVFGTGKVVITGARTLEEAQAVFDSFREAANAVLE